MLTVGLLVVGGVVCAGAIGLYFEFRYRGPPPALVIHPDDHWMVTKEDLQWFCDTSVRLFQKVLDMDRQARLASLKRLMDRGNSAEDAMARVRKSFPEFYVTLEEREDEYFHGEGARLPLCVRSRAGKTSRRFVMARGEFEMRHERTMTAIIRSLFRGE